MVRVQQLNDILSGSVTVYRFQILGTPGELSAFTKWMNFTFNGSWITIDQMIPALEISSIKDAHVAIIGVTTVSQAVLIKTTWC